ncbi:MAG: Cob(I)alamin adenosyltransferase [Candidatus Wolfebacteria bacterium GW2011_GWE2_44_13]|uniref:Cob(I)alamin adenosyltransferase n=1 Tax=Candidatus Wolfebacteria bacterium GW2011_GWE2_44_13 TaxID=1619017 RepID=A0A0G1H8Q3_9BACT|nr:MAG: Cob(I)alamin adenosyltransferase [Candidatus Wolfebacteria bacterium GW2011_GWE2_44_13]
MILINTGNGKGKTTAALGVALRALGYGKRVAMIQFIKGTWESGEDIFGKECDIKSDNFLVIKTGKGFVGLPGDILPFEEHKKAAEEGLRKAEELLMSKKYDLVILDEINNTVDLKLITEKSVIDILEKLPEDIDVILTGRNAPESFITLADTVTEMEEVKHAFAKGIKAKKGIDF